MIIRTKEDLDNFYKMDSELGERARHIASFFNKIDPDFDGTEDGIWYLASDSDYPDEEYVVCCNYDDYYWGEVDHRYVSFEPKWLFATDEEFQQYVDDVLAERERKEREKIRAEAEAFRQKQIERENRLKGLSREELLKELGVRV